MAHTGQTLEEINDSVNCRVQWTDSMVKLLLAEMDTYIESTTSPIHKQVWKNIAVSMNTHNYNVITENCNIKWISLKKKFKILKDASNQTGAGKQTWKYFDITNNMLKKKPKILPLSTASSTCGFQVNQNAVNIRRNINVEIDLSDDDHNKENELHFGSDNIVQNRVVRKRKSKTPTWASEMIEQKERHHKENYERERLLALLEKQLPK